MLRISCLVLVACNAAPPSPLALPVAQAASAPAAAAPLTGAHTSPITTLAVSPDGTAAVTGDKQGHIRLWPTLDGTREPVIIEGPLPQQLAVQRTPSGFALVVLDSARGAQLVQTGPDGAVREHAVLPGEVTELETVGGGFLVLHTDQTLGFIDPRGVVRGALTPEPGTHINAVLVRNEHVLALIQDGKQVRGRYVIIDARGVTWGDTTPKIPVSIKSAVLSRDGTQLAVQTPRGLHPALVKLATGKVEKVALCVEKRWPTEDDGIDVDQLRQGDMTPMPIGFVADNVLACSSLDRLVWWDAAGGNILSGNTMGLGAIPFAVLDERLVVAVNTSLALVEPQQTQFLGYTFHDIARIGFGPTGMFVDRNDQEQLLLDRELRDRARLAFGHNWVDAAALDDRSAVALIRHNRRVGATFHLAVFDMVARTERQLVPTDLRDGTLAFERTTGLVGATSDNPDGNGTLFQLDRKTHLFGAAMPLEPGWTQVFPLDPALANGLVALAVASDRNRLVIGEIRAADVRGDAPIRPSAIWWANGPLRTVDRAGRVYVEDRREDGFVVYAHGGVAATLAGVLRAQLTPSPDGAYVAALQGTKLKLMSAAGATAWETTQWGANSVGWVGKDLFVQYVAGLARLDVATGGIAARRCGWAFGLTEQAPEAGQNLPSICDAH